MAMDDFRGFMPVSTAPVDEYGDFVPASAQPLPEEGGPPLHDGSTTGTGTPASPWLDRRRNAVLRTGDAGEPPARVVTAEISPLHPAAQSGPQPAFARAAGLVPSAPRLAEAMASWDTNAADPAFGKLPAAQRQQMKEDYFKKEVAPTLPAQTRTGLEDFGIHLEPYADTRGNEDREAAAAARQRDEQAHAQFMAHNPVHAGWREYLGTDLPRDAADVLPKLRGYATAAADWFGNSPGGNVQARLVQQYLADPGKLNADTRAAVAPMAEAFKQRQAANEADLAPLRKILGEEAQRQALESPGQRLISGTLDSAPDMIAATAGQAAGIPAQVTFTALQAMRGYGDARAQGLSEDEALTRAGISAAANGLMFPVAEVTGGAAGRLTSKLSGDAASRIVGDKLGAAVGGRAGNYVEQGTTMAGLGAASGGAQEAYDEYRAGRIDFGKLAERVGDEAAQGFVAGLVPAAGGHAASAAKAGMREAVHTAAARSAWDEMNGSGAPPTQVQGLVENPQPPSGTAVEREAKAASTSSEDVGLERHVDLQSGDKEGASPRQPRQAPARGAASERLHPVSDEEHQLGANAAGVDAGELERDGLSAVTHLVASDPDAAMRLHAEHPEDEAAFLAAVKERVHGNTETAEAGAVSAGGPGDRGTAQEDGGAGQRAEPGRAAAEVGQPLAKEMADETPVTDSPAFSRGRMRDTQGAAAGMRALGEFDEAHQLRRSHATSLEGAARDIDPAIRVQTIGTGRPGIARSYEVTMPDEVNTAKVHETTDGKVFVDASDMSEGAGGRSLYQAVGDYAHNTGKVFAGDPAGLSGMGLRRRTEQMAASALRWGTAEHLEPHPRQLAGDPRDGVEPLRWGDDDQRNIENLLHTAYRNVAVRVPELANIHYNFGRRRFEWGPQDESADRGNGGGSGPAPLSGNSRGVEATGADFDRLAHSAGARAARAGRTTLARAAYYASLVREGRRQGWPGLLAALAQQHGDDGLAPALHEILYSRDGGAARGARPRPDSPPNAPSDADTRAPTSGARSFQGADDAGAGAAGKRRPAGGMAPEAVRGLVDRISSQWRNGPKIHVLRSMEEAPEAARMADRQQRSQGAGGQPRGFFHQGEAYLVADALRGPFEAVQTLFHEALGHYGLRGVFGDRLKPVLRQVAAARVKDVAAKMREYGFDPASDEHRLRAAEELLAEMAERYPDLPAGQHSMVRRAVDAVKDALRAIGVPLHMSDEEIARRFLVPARQWVRGSAAGRDTVASRPRNAVRETDPLLSRATREEGYPGDAGSPIATFRSAEELKKHPDYAAAKAGDVAAGWRLVHDLVEPAQLQEARRRFGPGAIYAPARATEATGRNSIPNMLALLYAQATDGSVAADLVQTNRAHHTGADQMERLAVRPLFDGAVPGGRYVLVDDVSTMGGTLAEMADHIRAGGGKVVGSVLLANASRSGRLKPFAPHVRLVEERFGDEIKDRFHVEPKALTYDEARYLAGFRDVEQLRARAAKAEGKRGGGLRSGRTGEAAVQRAAFEGVDPRRTRSDEAEGNKDAGRDAGRAEGGRVSDTEPGEGGEPTAFSRAQKSSQHAGKSGQDTDQRIRGENERAPGVPTTGPLYLGKVVQEARGPEKNIRSGVDAFKDHEGTVANVERSPVLSRTFDENELVWSGRRVALAQEGSAPLEPRSSTATNRPSTDQSAQNARRDEPAKQVLNPRSDALADQTSGANDTPEPAAGKVPGTDKVAQAANRDGLPIREGDDVGLAAGMSEDGRTSVHDAAMPRWYDDARGRRFDLRESRDYHERVEKALLDAGHTYPEAHRAATEVEHARMRQLGFDPNAVEAYQQPYIDRAAHRARAEGSTTPDVTAEPYIDSGELGMRRDAPADPRFVLDREGRRYDQPVHGKLLDSIETVTGRDGDGGYAVMDPHSGKVLKRGSTFELARMRAERMASNLGRRRLQERLDAEPALSQQQLRERFRNQQAEVRFSRVADTPPGRDRPPPDEQSEMQDNAPPSEGRAVSARSIPEKGAVRTDAAVGANNRVTVAESLRASAPNEAVASSPNVKNKWALWDFGMRPFGPGFMGKRIPQNNPRVDAYELKINPNNESFYLRHPNGGLVQFENLLDGVLKDGKLVMKPKSVYRVYDVPYARKKILEEARRQTEAATANNLRIQWLVSDKEATSQLSGFLADNDIGIDVIYFPE